MSGREWRVAAAAIVVMLLALGCGAQEHHHEVPTPDTTSKANPPAEFVNPAEVPQPRPPQPEGLQVGKADSLMNAIGPKLVEWVEMWRPTLPGFEVDSLWGSAPKRIGPLYTTRLEGDIEHKDSEEDVAFRVFGMRSPDGRYILDVDSYQVVEPDGDTLQVGGEPDSRCSLIDLRGKTDSILQSCGTPCGFEWGEWISPTSFVIGGWYDPQGYGQWFQGTLSVYSLRDSTVAEYTTRIASAGDFARHVRAWRQWLLKRYRTVTASHPKA